MKLSNLLAILVLVITFVAGYQLGVHASDSSSVVASLPPVAADDAVHHHSDTIQGSLLVATGDTPSQSLPEQIIAPTQLKAMAKSIFDTADTDELISLAATVSFLKEDELKNLSHPREYLEKMFSIVSAQPGTLVGGSGVSSLYFSSSINSDNTADLPQEYFADKNAAIYASFQTPENQDNQRVIVRWSNAESGKVVTFQRYTIKPMQQNHYIWTQPSNGWQAGMYTVEIYRDDDGLSPLAQGSFFVGG